MGAQGVSNTSPAGPVNIPPAAAAPAAGAPTAATLEENNVINLEGISTQDETEDIAAADRATETHLEAERAQQLPPRPPAPSINEFLLPSGTTLADACKVPETTCQFNSSAHQNINAAEHNALNAHTDFHKATATLVPLEPLRRKLTMLKNALCGSSLHFDKQQTSIKRSRLNPNFVHTCVRTKAIFHVPSGSENYSELVPVYDKTQQDLKTVLENFHRLSSDIITKGQEVAKFQLRLERLNLFFSVLIQQVACVHASHYRKVHKTQHPLEQGYQPKSEEQLASTAVYRLLQIFDAELLEYFNRRDCGSGKVCL